MHRRGITLTEVLVAIFICGLGLMALMTLFPLGAMNMAQAIKDDRCGHCAQNAASILRAYWRISLETGGQISGAAGAPSQPDPVWSGIETALANGPVFIDPIGVVQFNGTPLAGVIPRMSLDPNKSYTQAVRWCTLLDDINFNPNGTPVLSGSEVQRQGWYSWAWMIHWLRPADPNARARALDYSIVVYHQRPIPQSKTLQPVGENQYPAVFDAPNRMVTVTYGGNKPAIRKGGWILEPTQGYFYRVESIKDTGTTMLIGVQTPFRGNTGGTVVFMDSVAEVFERSTLE